MQSKHEHLSSHSVPILMKYCSGEYVYGRFTFVQNFEQILAFTKLALYRLRMFLHISNFNLILIVCWKYSSLNLNKKAQFLCSNERSNKWSEGAPPACKLKKRPALKSENWSQQMKFWWLFLCALLQRRVIARRRRDRQTAGNLRVHTFQFLDCQFTKCTQTKCKKNEKWISMICWEKWPCVVDWTLSWVVCIIKCRMKLGSEDK